MVFNRAARRRLAWLSKHTVPGKQLHPKHIPQPVRVPRDESAFQIDGNTNPRSLRRAMRRGYEHFALVGA